MLCCLHRLWRVPASWCVVVVGEGRVTAAATAQPGSLYLWLWGDNNNIRGAGLHRLIATHKFNPWPHTLPCPMSPRSACLYQLASSMHDMTPLHTITHFNIFIPHMQPLPSKSTHSLWTSWKQPEHLSAHDLCSCVLWTCTVCSYTTWMCSQGPLFIYHMDMQSMTSVHIPHGCAVKDLCSYGMWICSQGPLFI